MFQPRHFAAIIAYAGFALSLDESRFSADDIIVKDVAIIGGGASGTYGAVKLREDHSTSIVLIETDDHLGGHVNTYADPVTGQEIDYGVEAYLRYGNSSDFFARFNIPIVTYNQSLQNNAYLDIGTGATLDSYVPPSFPELLAAIEGWSQYASKYTDIILPGLWNFPSGDDIPDELFAPFEELAVQYNVSAAIPTLAVISNIGVGGIKDIAGLYVLFAFSDVLNKEFLSGDLFVPFNASNSLLYQKAQALLSDDLLLQSRVMDTNRTSDGVSLVVQGSDGCQKLVKAKRLLFTPPPSLEKTANFDTDEQEQSLFSQWTGTWSFTGIARFPGIPENTTVNFYAPSTEPDDYVSIRDSPDTLSVTSSTTNGRHLFNVLYASNYSQTYVEAKSNIAKIIQGVEAVGPYPNATGGSDIEWVTFTDHNSILWRQPEEVIRGGFVQDLYGLQGRRSTWWTGGLWSEDYTGTVWAFTDTVLPRLLADLETAAEPV